MMMNNVHRTVFTFSITTHYLNMVNGYNIFVLAIIIVNFIGDITTVPCSLYRNPCNPFSYKTSFHDRGDAVARYLRYTIVVSNTWAAIDIYLFENVEFFFFK